jgi:hypothetical protein
MNVPTRPAQTHFFRRVGKAVKRCQKALKESSAPRKSIGKTRARRGQKNQEDVFI